MSASGLQYLLITPAKTICDHVAIGAGAVVTKDITTPGVYAGNPARLLRRL
jgi:acetyltransferase-like isoleucine patch superfamily enzyme